MSRKAPPDPSSEVKKRTNNGFVSESRTYQLITPLFGGGAEPQKADLFSVPVSAVRGSSIRGHLRFWWRATYGGKFGGDLAAMKKAEDDLWGSAAQKGSGGPAKVNVAVKMLTNGTPREYSTIPRYVSFPLHETQGTIQEDVNFELTVSYPHNVKPDQITQDDLIRLKAEVNAALWAWETFGGIGGRTRRGCGALQCIKINDKTIDPPSAVNFGETIREQLKRHVSSGVWPVDVPHLTRNIRIEWIQRSNVNTAWRNLIRKWQDFRLEQKRGKPSERLSSPLLLRPLACGHGQAIGLALILQLQRKPNAVPDLLSLDRMLGDPVALQAFLDSL